MNSIPIEKAKRDGEIIHIKNNLTIEDCREVCKKYFNEGHEKVYFKIMSDMIGVNLVVRRKNADFNRSVLEQKTFVYVVEGLMNVIAPEIIAEHQNIKQLFLFENE